MNKEETAQPLTTAHFMQAVAQAGEPKAVQAAFDGLRLANDQLDKDYDRILDQFPRHWIAMRRDGMIANVMVPEDSTEEEEKQALQRLFEPVGKSEDNRTGYLVRYIDPEAKPLILSGRNGARPDTPNPRLPSSRGSSTSAPPSRFLKQ